MKKEKKILVTGNFNILHPGHLRLLKFAKGLGDKLIVGVNSDKLDKKGIHVSGEMRLENVKSNIWVDEAFMIDEPVDTLIKKLKPNFVVKGKEYEGKENPELEALSNIGGRLIFSSGDVNFSSTDLIAKDLLNQQNFSLNYPKEYIQRHKLKNKNLRNILKSFKNKKICVIGDLIIDEYINCDPLGMSQEDPTLVVTPVESKKFIGGAGIVASHAASLGAKTSIISITGKDSTAEFAKKRLKEMNVKSFLFEDLSRPTTLKQRFRSKEQSLLRVSHLHQSGISSILQNKIYKKVFSLLKDIDVLIFSDFNYGSLPQSLVDKIIASLKGKKIITAADSQSSSQIGDISRFKDMDFIFPTEHEARLSMRNKDDGLVVLAEKLSKLSRVKNIILKLGSEGILLHLEQNQNSKIKTDRLGALNNYSKDVAGAGDSMLVTTVLSYASGASIWESAYLGSLAAAIQVGRVGNIPLLQEEFLNKL
tara:strand:+ start:13652 stop:15085 length:1434 start_codon:yes stop_codon:yes gene_type:complete